MNKTITFAFGALPSNYPGLIMNLQGLLEKRGYNLQLVPLAAAEQDISPEDYAKLLQNGTWDIWAGTVDGMAEFSDPSVGAITALIAESAGVDKIVARSEIATLNDLRGKRISFAEESISEYFFWYTLSLAGISSDEVTLLRLKTSEEAISAYMTGQADAVVAREPEIIDAQVQGGKVLVDSGSLRVIIDALITSRVAINTKSEGVQAFHDAWFEALKFMIDSPTEAEQALLALRNEPWMFIKQPGDLKVSLNKIAQATLSANQIAFRNTQILASRLNEAQHIYTNVGGEEKQPIDLKQLIDSRFTLAVAEKKELYAIQPPVNDSFLLTIAQVELPQIQLTDQQAHVVVQLPLKQIDFEPNTFRLTEQAQQYLRNEVMPVLQNSTFYLKVEGSSAWPGPDGRYTIGNIREFAETRATSVAIYLGQQGVSPNRLLISTLDPQFPNCISEDDCAKDRFVKLTLLEKTGH